MCGGEGMVFSATFNNISSISLRSVLLVGETQVPGENHRPALINYDTKELYYKKKLLLNMNEG